MRDLAAGLSEHDFMRDHRLPQWGFWSRLDTSKPNAQRICSSIYHMGRADRQGDGESGEEMDDLQPRVDTADCEYLDGYIRQLSALHKAIIRDKFYKRLPINRMDTDSAVRGLLDLIADNRRVVDVMKRLGWT
jgi:hypothetical protein